MAGGNEISGTESTDNWSISGIISQRHHETSSGAGAPAGRRSSTLGAFGKHPGWNDHIDDIGPGEANSSSTPSAFFYIQGMSGNIELWARGITLSDDDQPQTIPPRIRLARRR